ncbi:hypothetical protein PAL_GLEAN10011634 [Pteropus alecto]|uniref:Uncharacterized protein n=1 Tax=Pteropus alecto TaxID=9402 RepID=L5KJM2_PTEAL|nr:hypothetical protein PAL_GLEAN10011634 [Pteropus alecto]
MTNTPSQVLDSGKDLKVLLEETAPLGATRESLRSHLKQEVYPEEHTLKGSRSSQQRPREQSKDWFPPEVARNCPLKRRLQDQETGVVLWTAEIQAGFPVHGPNVISGLDQRKHTGPQIFTPAE